MNDNVVRGGNSAGTARQAGIILGDSSTVRCRASGNVTNTLRVANCDFCLAQHNNITDAAGLTTASLTNTTVSQNLINGVYT